MYLYILCIYIYIYIFIFVHYCNGSTAVYFICFSVGQYNLELEPNIGMTKMPHLAPTLIHRFFHDEKTDFALSVPPQACI